MARQPDVQYIHYYIDGSAAKKLEPQRKPKKKVELPQPRVRRDKRTVIHVDPISLCALAVAAVMLVAMAVGMIQLGLVNADAAEMEGYVATLQSENARLHAEYDAGYDLADIEQKALAMGLVPVEQVEHVAIHVEIPEAEAEPTFWENVSAFWTELFSA